MGAVIIITFLLWILANLRRQLLLTYWWQVKEFRFDRFLLFFNTSEGKSKLEVFTLITKVIVLISSLFEPRIFTMYLLILFYESCKLFIEVWSKSIRKPTVAVRSNNVLLTSGILLVLMFLVALITQNIQLLLIADILSFTLPFVGSAWTQISYNSALTIETVKAKQKLEEIRPRIIAITGSQGKSTTKHLLHHIMSSHFNTIETPLSHNTPFGIVRTINSTLNNKTDYFIAEMGAYKKGEIKKLTQITPPDIAVITGISPQHIGLFGNMEKLIEAKYEIAEGLSKSQPLFVNTSTDNTKKIMEKAKKDMKLLFTYSLGRKADYYSIIKKQDEAHTVLEFHTPKKSYVLTTNLTFNHLLENLTGAMAVSAQIGVPISKIKSAVRTIPQFERAIAIKKLGKVTIIDDSYNSTPQGFEAAVKELYKHREKKLIVVTSGISELGELEYEIHKKLAHMLKDVHHVFVTNPSLYRAFKAGGIEKLTTYADKAFLPELKDLLTQESTVFLIEGRIPAKVYALFKNQDE